MGPYRSGKGKGETLARHLEASSLHIVGFQKRMITSPYLSYLIQNIIQE